MSARLVLSAGRLEAHILPAAGGSLARFDWLAERGRVPLLRGTDADDVHALDCGCFPLVPFCNRIRGGAFDFRGRTVRLAPNMPPDRSPLHGQGWLEPWQLLGHGVAHAVLSYRHEAGEWPWTYEAQQAITLTPEALEIVLSCRNLAADPMPCGLGLHPYYPCDAETRLDTQVGGAWTVDADVLPVQHVPAAGQFDLADRAICGQDLDHGFDGWSGSATIRWAHGHGLHLSSPDARFFQVFSPASGGLFVAEPVQHANCALNAAETEWHQLGMAVLQPGEQRVLRARFALLDQPASAATYALARLPTSVGARPGT